MVHSAVEGCVRNLFSVTLTPENCVVRITNYISVRICKQVPPGFFSNSVICGLFSTWPNLTGCSSQKKKKKKTCVYNTVYISSPHPSPLPIISHNSHRVIKQYTFGISARRRSCSNFRGWLISRFLFTRLQQSFPEGIITPYEGTSLTISKVCRRPICYRISSHFG